MVIRNWQHWVKASTLTTTYHRTPVTLQLVKPSALIPLLNQRESKTSNVITYIGSEATTKMVSTSHLQVMVIRILSFIYYSMLTFLFIILEHNLYTQLSKRLLKILDYLVSWRSCSKNETIWKTTPVEGRTNTVGEYGSSFNDSHWAKNKQKRIHEKKNIQVCHN